MLRTVPGVAVALRLPVYRLSAIASRPASPRREAVLATTRWREPTCLRARSRAIRLDSSWKEDGHSIDHLHPTLDMGGRKREPRPGQIPSARLDVDARADRPDVQAQRGELGGVRAQQLHEPGVHVILLVRQEE